MSQVREGFVDHFNLGGHSLGTDDVEIGQVEPEVEEVPSYYKRRGAGVWACLASLALILVAVATYGYNVMQQQDQQVSRVPGIATSISAVGQHVVNIENRLADARADQRNLAAQILTIGAESKAALNVTQQQTEAMIAHAQETVFPAPQSANRSTSAGVGPIASRPHDRTAAKMKQLEQELLVARYEIASTRRDYTRQVEAFRELQDELHREIAAINNPLPALPLKLQRSGRPPGHGERSGRFGANQLNSGPPDACGPSDGTCNKQQVTHSGSTPIDTQHCRTTVTSKRQVKK